MKKNFKYAFMSAIAFVGAVSFSACSSSDEIVDNPDYNPEKNTVTTNFVLNVAYADPASTRQSATTVQKNINFRGIQDAKLIALGTGNSSFLAPYDGSVTTGDGYVKTTFDLGTLYSSTAITPSTNADASSHRVLQLELPVNSDAMLIYGRAIPTGTNDENGIVDVNIAANPESSTFKLVSRLKGSAASGVTDRSAVYDQTLSLAASLFNRIMGSTVVATDGVYTYNSGQSNQYTSSAALPAVAWKNISGEGNGLQHSLRVAYDKIRVQSGEYRNGSSQALRNQVLDIYKTVDAVLNATSTNDTEVNAQRLAKEIKGRIDRYFDVNLSAEPNTIAFKSIGTVGAAGTIADALISNSIISETNFSSQYGNVTDADLIGFPSSFNLPEGTALLKESDGTFAYKNTTADTDNSLIGQTGHMSADKYMYPAEILYFDNSSLYVSTADKKESDYPNGYSTWDNYDWSTNSWTRGAVSSSTKSVAVKNNVNYGVAMLQTKVGFAEAASYVDNRQAITGEANQSFTTSQMGNFKLTGVLIGNQYNQVGWNYIATGTDASYVIYDKAIPANFNIPTTAGNENYTLVFDNWVSGGSQTGEVYVALEFLNNAQDFYGNKNLIPYGGTFYLVGKLKLSDGTGSISWDTNYATPPYTAEGESTKDPRVFIQNYVTTATFNIGETSLQKAFLTVPDLRSTQMSLGLSVDLSWRQGLTFTVPLGQ